MTKEIELKSGEIILVDNEDYERLSEHKWYKLKGARCTTTYAFNPAIGLMHRYIMKPPDSMQIDHIDGDGLNNQKSNLRIANQTQQNANQKKSKNKTSRYKGVHISKGKYRAQITVYGNVIRLGYYEDEREAAIVYNNAAKKYFGEYAKLNDIR